MRRLQLVALAWVGCATSILSAETVRLKATADVGLSSETYGGKDERLVSMGLSKRFKLKSVQEMAAIRFDAGPAKGKEVLKAALLLRRMPGPDMLRYVRVSTINQNWEEGKTVEDYGPPSGACYLYADYDSKRPWAWPGSVFADVVMTSGNSLATYAERKELPDGWVSVALTPELVYALVAGDSDGLAICDGGNLAFHNNFIHSVQSGAENAPYIQVELGKELKAAPAGGPLEVSAAREKAHVGTGAIKLEFAPAKGVFCWQLKLDGKAVERWHVKHPAAEGPTVFYLEDLAPDKVYVLETTAIGPGGATSALPKLMVKSSPALDDSLKLGPLAKPASPATSAPSASTMPAPFKLWAAPPLVKISPEKSAVMNNDAEEGLPYLNSVWDGHSTARIFGARGEYVSFQVCVENRTDKPQTGLRLLVRDFVGPDGAKIGGGNIELYKNWYVQNGKKQWQPAYCVPIKNGQTHDAVDAFDIPDPKRKLETQRNQTFYVDIYIPKDARPGEYTGAVSLAWGKGETGAIEWMGGMGFSVDLIVHDFELPDKLAFWPQLNSYARPKNWHSYFRLAHQHRNVFYYRSLAPEVKGAGKDSKVVWDNYDKLMEPLLSGEAFKDGRRAGVPIEAAALPFSDYWPTDLTPQTYNYKGYWPKRGDKPETLNEHYMNCPPIEEGLSQDYKDAFLAVERQFIEHFKAKGWRATEMQCVFVGKNTHRTQYGINMWWTTDEPYHWVDWLALRFFDRLFVQGRGGEPPKIWCTRADISRPQWQGLVLQGATDTVYFGGGAFVSEGEARRVRWLGEANPLEVRAYGSANNDAASNHGSLAWILNVWLNGGLAALPWQAIGGDGALDNNDGGGGGGNSLLVPGDRFGVDVVADIRLKAFRDAEQLIEYMTILSQRRGLNREQIRHMVTRAAAISARTATGASADNASALSFTTLKDWQIARLRRELAKLIQEKP